MEQRSDKVLILRPSNLESIWFSQIHQKWKGFLESNQTKVEIKWMYEPAVPALGHTHLSAMLADLILSMTMTCLLQHIEVDSATPRAAPGVLATSTSSGPDAVATESVKIRQQKISIIPAWYLCRFHIFPHKISMAILFL